MTTARSAVRDELLHDLDEVTTRIVGAIRAEIPTYDLLATTQLGEVQEIAAWGVGRVLEAWVDHTALTETDLARFRGIGAARALDGRPLPGVLRAYRIAGVEVTDLVAERAGGRLTVTDAIDLARLWMASIDALSEALYGGHRDALDRMSQHPARAVTDLLEDLVQGRHATTAAVAARTRHLGLDLPGTLTLVVAHSPRGAEDLQAWHTAVTACLSPEPAASDTTRLLHGVRDGVLVAVTGGLDRERLAAMARTHRWRCVVQETRSEGVARCYRSGTTTLHAAPLRAWTAHDVLDEVDVAVLARVRGDEEPGSTVLRRRLAEPLAGHPELAETLEAHLDTGTATGAAHALGCHVQTVRHRISRIRRLTGRDLRQSWDRLALEMASLACHTQ